MSAGQQKIAAMSRPDELIHADAGQAALAGSLAPQTKRAWFVLRPTHTRRAPHPATPALLLPLAFLALLAATLCCAPQALALPAQGHIYSSSFGEAGSGEGQLSDRHSCGV